jgi:hypothetical protein
MPFFRKTTAARTAATAPQQPADSVHDYRNIRRRTIRSDDKQATAAEILRLANSSKPRDTKFAAGIVRDLLDFKAGEYQKRQAQMHSALASLRKRFQSPPQDAGVTYDACVMLVKNRSSVFKSKLPDTAKRLVEAVLRLQLPSPGVVSDANRDFLRECKFTQLMTLADDDAEIDKHVQSFFESCRSSNDKYFRALNRATSKPPQYYRYYTHADALNLICKDIYRLSDDDANPEDLHYFVQRPAGVAGAPGIDSMLLNATDWVRQQGELDLGVEGLLLGSVSDRRKDLKHDLNFKEGRDWGGLRAGLLEPHIRNDGVVLRLPSKEGRGRRLGGTTNSVLPVTIQICKSLRCWRDDRRRGARPARDIESIGRMCLAMCFVGIAQSFNVAMGLGLDTMGLYLGHGTSRRIHEESKEKLRNAGISKSFLNALNFFESNRVNIKKTGKIADGCNASSRSFAYHSFFMVEGGEEGRRWRRFVKYSVPVSVSFREAGAYYSLAYATSRGTIVSVSRKNFGRMVTTSGEEYLKLDSPSGFFPGD